LHRRATVKERQAARLADPDPPMDLSRALANVALVDLLLAPSFGLRSFIARQLLLDASYNEVLALTRHGGPSSYRGPALSRVLGRAARMASVALRPHPSRTHARG
jgi:hypothetical protein